MAAVWETIGKLITPQDGEVSPLILQLVVALKSRYMKVDLRGDLHGEVGTGLFLFY